MAHRPIVVHSARVLCFINGRLYGRVTGFSWTSLTPRKKIRSIDIPYIVELAATTVEAGWQMTIVRTIGDGGAQGAGIVASQVDISREKYFTILLIERETDSVIFKADYCQTDQEQWGVSPRGLLTGNISGTGIIWTNEASQ